MDGVRGRESCRVPLCAASARPSQMYSRTRVRTGCNLRNYVVWDPVPDLRYIRDVDNRSRVVGVCAPVLSWCEKRLRVGVASERDRAEQRGSERAVQRPFVGTREYSMRGFGGGNGRDQGQRTRNGLEVALPFCPVAGEESVIPDGLSAPSGMRYSIRRGTLTSRGSGDLFVLPVAGVREVPKGGRDVGSDVCDSKRNSMEGGGKRHVLCGYGLVYHAALEGKQGQVELHQRARPVTVGEVRTALRSGGWRAITCRDPAVAQRHFVLSDFYNISVVRSISAQRARCARGWR